MMSFDPFDFKNTMPSINEDSEFFPLMSSEDEAEMNNEEVPDIISILPLRNTVLFPGVVIPITVGRDKSIKLIRDANKGSRLIGVVSQQDVSIEDPTFDQLNKVGTIALIIKMLQMPDGNTTVILQGKKRFTLKEEVQTEPYIKASITPFKEVKAKEDKEFKAMVSSVKDMAMNIIQLSPNIPSEAGIAIRNIESTSFLINFISSNMNADMAAKQALLQTASLRDRINMVLEHLTLDLQMLELKNQIQTKVRVDLDKQQRDYFLNQQLKTIQEELGGTSPDLEIENLRQRALKKKWDKEVKTHFAKELEKLVRTNPAAADYSVQINYLELLLDLPWNDFTKDNFDLKRAQKVLDKDHFGLDKVKQRIIEYLAVLKLKHNMKAPILCLVGPPGVGKTSLGKSIAKALGRKYVRMALGGVRDEAEIRGHRKTYIGAMPGRIIQSVKKAGAANPVFILDEIDKVSTDFRGDPSSALLEVLDPEQNSTFYDNYVEMDFDLSNVMFIATANSLSSIQPALLDRMEIIEVNGYTIEEKIEIAKKHLLPKQREAHGLTLKDVVVKVDVLEKLIEDYTRESGVRTLEKRIGSVIRGVAKNIAMEEPYNVLVTKKEVEKILGAPFYDKDLYENNDTAGVVTGLAWTSVGGDILFIEASLSPGNGKLTITGSLGDVMKESVTIALAYLRAHAGYFNINPKLFEQWDIHVHVPAGATPKDGPSAGVTMLTALVSAFTQRKIKPHLAMTGEITLRGRVLPVGGIKEKILAAKRANIKEIILCKSNQKDILEIKEDYITDLKFHYVTDMREVINLALLTDLVSEPLDLTVKEKEVKPVVG
ncbi:MULTISPECIES: endopeptidase La [unclassified Mucilaginibacter]|uniref:endopeptidase La n=2 Tax=Mucilaginibacter TaxID=423349 RepID=UPI002AC8C20D|nr:MULTISPECIES: endopeptidase La [unclassified Mucilaginibacter]MEB0248695.1 endopeptidase La [Mucilaginibacter sp. 5B2]MEB0261480.1 endopeptidase La [Mucilaginibacter sp. 10I4]MEB0276934.1 endopeptidase La [Mucilaginibacter sp. 10B2]MEB0300746.1 endopeptidase La [Mucilaginibacter sp. 5C4]WPX25034.1 endopeptidase La [Mucilaginibacter sp. 5C4]